MLRGGGRHIRTRVYDARSRDLAKELEVGGKVGKEDVGTERIEAQPRVAR